VTFVVCDDGRVYAAEAEVDQSVDDNEVVISAAAAFRMLDAAKRHGDEPAQLVRAGNQVSLTIGSEALAVDACRCDERQWRTAVPCRKSQPTKVVASQFMAAVCALRSSSMPGDLLQVRFSRQFMCVVSTSGKWAALPALGTSSETVLHVDPQDFHGWLGSLDPDAVVTVDPGDGATPAVFSHDDALAVVPVATGSCMTIEEAA
jgi:hypothetical protein